MKEALYTYEVQMLKEHRVKPDNHVVSALLAVLGKSGYTKKAFEIFNGVRLREPQRQEQSLTPAVAAKVNTLQGRKLRKKQILLHLYNSCFIMVPQLVMATVEFQD